MNPITGDRTILSDLTHGIGVVLSAPYGVTLDSHGNILVADAAAYGLRRVHPVKANHGSYSFYCEDADSNWWEIEHRDAEISYAASVAQGDPT